MEHIKIELLNSGLYKLTPDEGYSLFNTITRKLYSAAEVSDVRPYVAVKIKD